MKVKMYFQMYFPCLKITTIYPQQFGKLIPQFKLDALKKEEWILIESFLLNSLWISVFFSGFDIHWAWGKKFLFY